MPFDEPLSNKIVGFTDQAQRGCSLVSLLMRGFALRRRFLDAAGDLRFGDI